MRCILQKPMLMPCTFFGLVVGGASAYTGGGSSSSSSSSRSSRSSRSRSGGSMLLGVTRNVERPQQIIHRFLGLMTSVALLIFPAFEYQFGITKLGQIFVAMLQFPR